MHRLASILTAARRSAQIVVAGQVHPGESHLQEDVVSAFYAPDRAGVPTAWIERVRETMRAGIPGFGARRAVKWAAERLPARDVTRPLI